MTISLFREIWEFATLSTFAINYIIGKTLNKKFVKVNASILQQILLFLF